MLDQFRAQKLEWNRANNQIYDRVEANSGDSNGRTLFVQILNGGMVEDLTGAILSLAWNKNGFEQGLESFEPINASKGQFLLYYPTGMLVNHGVLQASLVLIDVTGRIESKPFDIIVHKGTVDDGAVESDNKFTALTTALVKVSQVQAEFDSLYADKSLMMDQLKADKSNEMDQLYDDKNQSLTGLESDFADKAEILEQTYAPRLTGVETGLSDLEDKVVIERWSNKNGILWDTGLLHLNKNKGNLTSGDFWTNRDNFPYGLSYTIITDTTGYTNAPFTNASYIVMGNGLFFSVLAMQTNGTGIKYITGVSSSTDLSWQTVK